MHKRGLD